MKKCCKCKKTLSYKKFTKDYTKKDGLKSMCRECDRKRSAEYAKKNREARRIYAKEYSLKKKLEEKVGPISAEEFKEFLVTYYQEIDN